MYYLMMCSSIVNFVKDNTELILEKPEILNGLNISDIAYKLAGHRKYGSSDVNNYAGYIYEYIRGRKDYFYSDARNGIINGDEDNFNIRKRIQWSNNINADVELSKTRTRKDNSGRYGIRNEQGVIEDYFNHLGNNPHPFPFDAGAIDNDRVEAERDDDIVVNDGRGHFGIDLIQGEPVAEQPIAEQPWQEVINAGRVFRG